MARQASEDETFAFLAGGVCGFILALAVFGLLTFLRVYL